MYHEPNSRDKVALGAMLLDEEHPGWAQKINRDALSIQSCTHCILGQLYGIFGEGLRELGIKIGEPFGFAMNTYSSDPLENRRLWKELRNLWLEEIDARLGGAMSDEGGQGQEEVDTEKVLVNA